MSSRPQHHFGKLAVAFAIGFAALSPSAALAKLNSLSNLFVFGDSLSDSGNSKAVSNLATSNLATLPPVPYFDGRFSNGLVAAEYLWHSFNLGDSTFKASLAGGTNYAIGGSTTGTENFIEVWDITPNFLRPAYANLGNSWQLDAFKTTSPAFNPSTSLFLVWLFPNDAFYFNSSGQLGVGTFEGVQPSTQPIDRSTLLDNAVANIIGTIDHLSNQGATNFLVVNSPDLGLIPENINSSRESFLSELSTDFNALLAAHISALSSGSPELDITYFELDRLFANILDDPIAYGFSNVTDRCLVGSTVCADPDSYLFWDGSHPTTRTHKLIAERFFNSVYEVPGPAPVLGVALAISWSRKLRRRIQVHHHQDQASLPKNQP